MSDQPNTPGHAEPSPTTKLFGAFLIAVGVMMATLCGLCSAVFLVGFVASAFQGPGPSAAFGLAAFAPFIGGIPTAIGVLLAKVGLDMRAGR